MKTIQKVFHSIEDLTSQISDIQNANDFNLVITFGDISFFKEPSFPTTLKTAFPNATIAGCSTAGEISHEGVNDQTCVITCLQFDHVQLKQACARIEDMSASKSCGEEIAKALNAPDLKGVLVFSVGVAVNGSALVDGMASVLEENVQISGGLAGDGGAFSETFIISDKGVSNSAVVGVGLYGDSLQMSFGSFGGWEPFGPSRQVTKSDNNVLYELDGEPALNIYKKYLGEYAKDLPASGLLFPFEMLDQNNTGTDLIRTILAVDEDAGSLTLAGSIVEGGYLRLMHASNNALVDGAEKAAQASLKEGEAPEQGFALLVSCVGRKLVMGDQIDDELDAVIDCLGENITVTGFYSYGEINPLKEVSDCKLHNQTMTIALISE